MKVVLCDRGRMLREVLAIFLTGRGHDVVSSVEHFSEALLALDTMRPDVFLVDSELAGPAELRRLDACRGDDPAAQRSRVLLVTDPHQRATPADEERARALVDGVLDRTENLLTWERALTGPSPVRGEPRPAAASPTDTLTPRERDVVERLVAGRSTNHMAADLGVSRSTVHSHVQAVLRKLGVNSRLEAVSTYLRTVERESRLVRA